MMMENININTTMNEGGGGALFPIVFFDGDREIDLGTVLITPSMNFKAFQSMLSHKIGISPHQITTYFTPIHHNNHHYRRRHPVTNKFNFSAAIADSASCFFWVVLKRSRRVRRRSSRPKPADDHQFSPEGNGNNINNNNNSVVLLRRNPNVVVEQPDYMLDYSNRLRLLEMEQERYLMSLNLNSNVYSDLSFYSRANTTSYGGGGVGGGFCGMSSEDGASSSGFGSEINNRGAFCDVCLNAAMDGEETVPFHWCKNDAVTYVHRSPAGPIGPPAKNNRF